MPCAALSTRREGSPPQIAFVPACRKALNQVFVLAGQGVIAEVVVLRVVDLAQTDREFSCLDAILDHKREGHQGARCPGD